MKRPYQVTVNGSTYEVDLLERSADTVTFAFRGATHQVHLSAGVQSVTTTQLSSAATPPLPRARTLSGEPGVVRAPMPGLVVAIKVKVGDRVTASDTVAVIEAMKMENNLSAGCNGTVREIHVQAGKEVDNRAILVSITPE